MAASGPIFLTEKEAAQAAFFFSCLMPVPASANGVASGRYVAHVTGMLNCGAACSRAENPVIPSG